MSIEEGAKFVAAAYAVILAVLVALLHLQRPPREHAAPRRGAARAQEVERRGPQRAPGTGRPT